MANTTHSQQHIFVHFIPMLFISLVLFVLLGLTAIAIKPSPAEAYTLLAILVALGAGTAASWFYDHKHADEMPTIDA